MTPLSSPVVLVTGCSNGGIGHALCNEFSRRGCTVYATSRRLETMDKVAHLEENIHLKELDVTNDKSVQHTIQGVITEVGRLDIVVSNAGILDSGAVLDVPMDRVQRVFDTNVYGTLRLAQATIPHMASQTSGLFVIVGSVTGLVPTPWTGIYAASKATLHSIASNLQMECTPLGVKVMLLAPGGVTSSLSKNMAASFEMPENSLYKSYSNAIIERMWSSQTAFASPAADFAKMAVAEILKPNPPTFLSIGGGSWIFYLLTWVPRWASLAFVWRRFGKKK
ncbi:hypothetical protein FRB96_007357 [Tulasnella sp. 330]|nr:hypothetical protein FRB96_007357 [Tulasnella sp. 330]KAG8874978.1 hypothetical protein FRB98_008128 [Tulasnella sp. 332]